MPWLADLVESSEGSLNVLPVQCLCEFLLNSSLTNGDESEINQANTSGISEMAFHLIQHTLLQCFFLERTRCNNIKFHFYF